MRDLLTIDCGNTSIACLRHLDGARATLPSHVPQLESLVALWRPAQQVVVASVVPSTLSAVRQALSSAGASIAVVGEHLPCPLRLNYLTIETLGVDRWLGALAANRRFGAAITVDCGTATTVNFVTADGVFRGGAIAPGLDALAFGLAEKAPSLPRANLDAELVVPAVTSQQSVDAGVLLGYVGLVDGLVASVQRAVIAAGAGSKASVTVVLTGGNAGRVKGRVGFAAKHIPDLLHEGMAALLDGAACDS